MAETAETHHEDEVLEDTSDEFERQLDPEVLARREAALAEVRRFGDPVLKSPATPIATFDETLAREIEHMTKVMRDGLGVGLAATQLGVMHRVLVLQAGHDAPATALVNPQIEWLSNETETMEEGCLSLPGIIVDVERPLLARVTAHDPSGEPLTIEAAGLEARVIQHEVDHLDGVLILDRTEREQRKQALAALREGRSWRPPTELDKDGSAEE
jgi:peptide deformylase